MNLEYIEQSEQTRLRYCLIHNGIKQDDEIVRFAEIDHWTIKQFGSIGELWGCQRRETKQRIEYSSSFFRSYVSIISYVWRFKHKQDCILFKLVWGGSV